MPYTVKQERDGWDQTGRRTLTAYAAKASGADGVALDGVPAGKRARRVVQGLRERPRRTFAQAGDRGAGPQAAGRAVAVRHHRPGAAGRRPVEGLSAEGQPKTEHPGGPTGPSGETGQGV